TECQQQGRDHGGGCAESGGAFDETAEQPADDHGLDAAVRADVGEGGADGGQCSAVRQGAEQQQRAEHDVEQAYGEDEPLDAGGRDDHRFDAPDEGGDADHDGESDRHGVLGGPAQPDEEEADDRDGGQRDQAQ